MKNLLTPSLWKTAFAGVLLGALSMGHAQINDQGTLDFSGTISKTTCVLSFGDAQSTLAGRKTLSFGSIPTSQIPTGQFQGFLSVAPKQTVILSVKNADGTTCDGIGNNGKWDVTVTVPTANLVTATGGTKAIQSDGDRAAIPRRFTTDIGIVLQTSVNATVGNTNVDLELNSAGSTFGFLSGPGTLAPGLSANDTLAVSAQFLTLTSTAVVGPRTPGAYSVAIPLSVFYR
jgi:type 1 fimbria pilin